MADIDSRSRYVTTSLVYDLHHITRSVLHQIREEHRIFGYDKEASISHGPSIRPPMSSTPIRMQPIRGRWRGRVDQRGRGRDGGRGHGRDGEGSRRTPEPTLPTSIPPPPPPPPQYIPITRDFYIPTDLHITFHNPRHLHITFHTPRHLHIFTIFGVARASLHSGRYHLIIPPFIIPTLPPIGDTILDLVSELGTLPARRPRAPRIRRVLHPSAPSAPSAPFEIPQDPIDKLDVYFRRRPKRNIKTPSCETH